MSIRRYKLSQDFLDKYKDQNPPWGFADTAGNSMGEITFLRSYSRLKEDGSKETWADTCQRVVEGMFTIQREHCRRNQLPWDYKKAQRTAQDAYDRMFNFKWLPAGRGIANMGAPFIIDDWDSSPLMNCAFVSTKTDFSEAMHFLMLASMNGIGVGLDTLGEGKFHVRKPEGDPIEIQIADTREGWADALKSLIDSYLQGTNPLSFDYSIIRPKGALIQRFGGTASGPESLQFLLEWITDRLDSKVDSTLTITDIADIANQIGCCVVSGSSRRSAELLLGPQNEEYMDLKNYGKMEQTGETKRVAIIVDKDEKPVLLEDYLNQVDEGVREIAIATVLRKEHPSLARKLTHEDEETRNAAAQEFKSIQHTVEFERLVASEWAHEDLITEVTVPIVEWVPGPGAERSAFGWMSNNSVFAEVGQNYAEVAKRTLLNGEPGYVWMDTTRGFGRMKDRRDNKDFRAAGYNPSLVAGTMVYTTDGVQSIEDLENKDFFVRNLNGEISSAYCWKSGIDEDVFKVSLDGGHSYRATKEHKWPVWNGSSWEKKTTQEVSPGDLLPNLVTNSLYPEGTRGSYDEGFLIGWNLGDGWITRRPDGLQIGFMVSDNDRAHGIDKKIESVLSSLGSKANFDGKDEINVNNTALRKIFAEYGVRHKSEGLPDSVWDSSFSDEYRKGVIDGIFSADGTVDGSRVVLSQASEKMVRSVASLLGFFGIKTNITTLDLPASTAFPEKYADNKDKKFTRWTLRIGKYSNVALFHSLFTLTHGGKESKISSYLSSNTEKKNCQNFIKVVDVVADGYADVWDVTVQDETHAFQIDHCVTGNCAEQPLESYEVCNLVETYPTRAESEEDYLKTLKVAYLYGKTVTLLPTVFEQTNAIQMRNRRIGLSQTGITTYVDRNGIAQWRQLCDAGYKEVQRLDEVYSDWLCVRNSIRTTTVKPSGSVSLLTGDSPGVHWNPASGYYIRRVTMGPGKILDELRSAGYPVEESFYSAGQYVVSFPVKSPFRRSEKDVSIWEKVALAAEAQHWWSDNSVSVTVSYDPENEGRFIESILSMYEGRLKTVSFLPMSKGVYQQMPYEEISEEKYTALCDDLFPVIRENLYGSGEEALGEKFCTTDKCETEPVGTMR